jgi:hypothetical protein
MMYMAPHPRRGIVHYHRFENLKSYIIPWSGALLEKLSVV